MSHRVACSYRVRALKCALTPIKSRVATSIAHCASWHPHGPPPLGATPPRTHAHAMDMRSSHFRASGTRFLLRVAAPRAPVPHPSHVYLYGMCRTVRLYTRTYCTLDVGFWGAWPRHAIVTSTAPVKWSLRVPQDGVPCFFHASSTRSYSTFYICFMYHTALAVL